MIKKKSNLKLETHELEILDKGLVTLSQALYSTKWFEIYLIKNASPLTNSVIDKHQIYDKLISDLRQKLRSEINARKNR